MFCELVILSNRRVIMCGIIGGGTCHNRVAGEAAASARWESCAMSWCHVIYMWRVWYHIIIIVIVIVSVVVDALYVYISVCVCVCLCVCVCVCVRTCLSLSLILAQSRWNDDDKCVPWLLLPALDTSYISPLWQPTVPAQVGGDHFVTPRVFLEEVFTRDTKVSPNTWRRLCSLRRWCKNSVDRCGSRDDSVMHVFYLR